MKKWQVSLFSAQKLFGEGIEQTLRGIEGLDICGHWPIDGQVIERLTTAVPDFVILMDEGASHEELSTLTAKILDRFPDLPVFRVTLEENQIRVYSSQLFPARSANLIDLIQNLPVKDEGMM
jgi:DNA-binding NarL/FixJ family response regulator